MFNAEGNLKPSEQQKQTWKATKIEDSTFQSPNSLKMPSNQNTVIRQTCQWMKYIWESRYKFLLGQLIIIKSVS